MTDNDERPTGILIDAPVGPFSTPHEIRAWLKELDELDLEVAPHSQATEMIAMVREHALSDLRYALLREQTQAPT